MGKVKVIIPAKPNDENLLLDACLAFFPQHFVDCPSLDRIREKLNDVTRLDFDLGIKEIPEEWNNFREEAKPAFKELNIFEAELKKIGLPKVMDLPENINLPFFAYGTFKPKQLGFYRIADCVERVETDCEIKGDLLVRDGLPIVDEAGKLKVNGSLIFFKPDNLREAYERIIEIEPDKHYRWGETNVHTVNEDIQANVLYGRSPKKGSVRIKDSEDCYEWDGSKDPLFTSALEVIAETLEQNSEFDWNLKSLFRLQMAYLLLWSSIERYVSLRYHLGNKVTEKIYHLAEEDEFIQSLKDIVKESRQVFRADKPTERAILDSNNPRKSIEYYYQVRSNLTHRGKSADNDFKIIKSSLEELYKIFVRVKDKAFNPDDLS